MLKEWLGMAEGILQDLHQDHEEVSGLIEQCLKTEASAERNQIFKEIMSMLIAHSEAEQQVVEQQLQQMARTRNKASEQWTAQLTVLKELVNHHVKEEESTGFSCARNEFEREELEKMSGQFQRQKEKLMAEA